MKKIIKQITSTILVLVMAFTIFPGTTGAAVTPYFVIINETLLAFNEETMPLIVGGEIFIPAGVFEHFNIWEVGSDDAEHIRVYRGRRHIDFFTRPGETRTIGSINNVENLLRWPSARRIGSRFYIPLRQVTEFFGLNYQQVPIPDSIISSRQMYAIRIFLDSTINGPTAVGMNRAQITQAYNNFFSTPLPPPPQPGGAGTSATGDEVAPPRVPETAPPDFSDVTIHLSFMDIAAGSASWILDLLEMQAALGFLGTFFVSADDIHEDPGLIRRISGTGHTLGIWLNEGTIEEYLSISALLFDAAKIRTVLVSSYYAVEQTRQMAQDNGLIFWDATKALVDYSAASISAITGEIPRESGAVRNLMFTCSEQVTAILPGVYSYLRNNLFNVSRITETTLVPQ